MMTPAEAGRVAALERQLADLARRVGNARGLGVNTAFGTTHYRTTQLGFPVELTSAWSASTGYSWKRLGLDVLDVTDPEIQPVGNKAVTPGNDQSLKAGAIGWLEPDPDSRGWFFVQDTNAESTAPVDTCLSKFVGWPDASCLRVYVLQGADPGACSNIDYQQLDAAPAPGGGWVTNDTFAVPGGDAVVEIYRGAGGQPGAVIKVWTGSGFETVYGVYVGCSGSSLEFAFPSDPLLCEDAEEECGDNTVRVRAACIPCETPTCAATCDCAACGAGAPGTYTFTLAGGTGDFVDANGSWSLCIDPETCEWSSEPRGGWTAIYTRSGTTGTLRLDYGSIMSGLYLEYTVDPVTLDCCANNTLALTDSGGTGTEPTSPTIITLETCGPCLIGGDGGASLKCCPDDGVPAQLDLTLGGGFAAYGDVKLYFNAVTNQWEGSAADAGIGDLEVTLECTSVSPTNPGSWLLTMTFGDCGVVLDTGASTVCDPFYSEFSGTLASPPPCDTGAWTGVVTG